MVHQIHMFEHIRIVLLEGRIRCHLVEFPDYIAFQVLYLVVVAVPGPFGTLYILSDIVAAAIYLTAHAVQMDSVLEFEIDAELVVLVSGYAAVTGAECRSLDRLQSGHPEEDIYVVHMLLHDMVSGKPFPVHPVTEHPFHVAPACLTLAVPEHSLVPVDISSGDLADISFLYLLESLHIRALMMTLRSCHHAQALGLCLTGGGYHRAASLRIHRYRLLEETVHAFLGGIFEMLRTENRRSGQDNHVYTGIDDFPV